MKAKIVYAIFVGENNQDLKIPLGMFRIDIKHVDSTNVPFHAIVAYYKPWYENAPGFEKIVEEIVELPSSF